MGINYNSRQAGMTRVMLGLGLDAQELWALSCDGFSREFLRATAYML